MALTPSRWVLAAIAACAVVGTLILRDSATRPAASDPVARRLQARSNMTRRLALNAAERLRVRELRDSLARAHAGALPSVRVSFDPALPARPRVILDSLLQIARGRRPDRGAVPLQVVFILDTATSIRGVVRSNHSEEYDYLLPSAATHGSCVSVVRLGRDWLSGNPPRYFGDLYWFAENQTDLFVGPCAYYAAFGPPGPAVEHFLRDRGFRFARGGTWAAQARPLVATTPPTADIEQRNEWLFRLRTQSVGQACAAGDLPACTRAFFDTTGFTWRPWDGVLSSGIAGTPFVRSGWNVRYGLGPVETRVLADMESSLGRERFARFWTSPRPVEQAFRDAAGESIGEWTRDWMRTTYGEHQRGAAIAGPSVAFAALLSILAIAGAVMVARRRTVA